MFVTWENTDNNSIVNLVTALVEKVRCLICILREAFKVFRTQQNNNMIYFKCLKPVVSERPLNLTSLAQILRNQSFGRNAAWKQYRTMFLSGQQAKSGPQLSFICDVKRITVYIESSSEFFPAINTLLLDIITRSFLNIYTTWAEEVSKPENVSRKIHSICNGNMYKNICLLQFYLGRTNFDITMDIKFIISNKKIIKGWKIKQHHVICS